MRLLVAAIGRLKDGPERELAERYRKRAEQVGRRIGFRTTEIVEIRESRAQELGKRRTEESIALANVIPDRAVTVILDERGESLEQSLDFALRIDQPLEGCLGLFGLAQPLFVGQLLSLCRQ